MSKLVTHVATGQTIGTRKRQEDAVMAYAPQNGDPAIAILSDGMGGHEDGDLAGRIIASEMFSELFVASARHGAIKFHAGQIFRDALHCANGQLQHHMKAGRISENTGGTLVCATVTGGQLHWLSVGDSWLYLFRQGQLKPLNEIHSMASQLDKMVECNQIDETTALTHPDRHCLTSAVTGREIPKVDCPEMGLDLEPHDIVILASDGIDVLGEAEICRQIKQTQSKSSEAIAAGLLDAIKNKADPDQDNSSVIAIKVASGEHVPAPGVSRLGRVFSLIGGMTRTRLAPAKVR